MLLEAPGFKPFRTPCLDSLKLFTETTLLRKQSSADCLNNFEEPRLNLKKEFS